MEKGNADKPVMIGRERRKVWMHAHVLLQLTDGQTLAVPDYRDDHGAAGAQIIGTPSSPRYSSRKVIYGPCNWSNTYVLRANLKDGSGKTPRSVNLKLQ